MVGGAERTAQRRVPLRPLTVFALGLGLTSREGAQWQWGYLATAPYALCACLALALDRLRLQRTSLVRVGLLGLVLLGSVAIPLGLEARWRVAQPEVGVIHRAGDNLKDGRNLYPSYYKHGKLVDAMRGTAGLRIVLPVLPTDGHLRVCLPPRRTRARVSPTRESRCHCSR